MQGGVAEASGFMLFVELLSKFVCMTVNLS